MLFNQAESVLEAAAADVNQVAHEGDYQMIVSTLTDIHRRKPDENAHKAAQEIEVTAQSSVSLEKDPIHVAVDDYFCDVIDSGQPKSALEYFEERELEFDKEVWIYQVIGGYQSLDENDKQFFALDASGQPDAVYTGNFYINDVTLGLR